MDTTPATNDRFEICTAERKDLEQIVALLTDDVLGSTRERSFVSARAEYEAAFSDINQSPDNTIFISKRDGKVIACLQLTLIPNLTFTGAKRCLIEGVRVSKNYRGKGIGNLIMRHAIDHAKTKGCRIVQLTSNNTRPAALKFYEALGFEGTHTGFKLYL